MKFFHLADLHLGKRVNGFPMIEDQKIILDQILELADTEHPDAVVIAGDVYDKSIPSVEAVNLMDDFLVELVRRKLQVFVISGNHDSAERVSYGGRVMEQSGIHISPRISGCGPIRLDDQYGPLYIYLIPYIHPSVVREAYPEEKVTDWTQAMEVLIRNAHVDPAARNIAVAHQYVTASGVRPEECDSEQKHIGGLDNVDYSVFDAFDYVALGHLHGPQRIGRDTVRYAGSPIKYSFSEEKHKKSVTLVEIKEKGQVEYRQLPLVPARDFKTLRGTFGEVMSPGFTAPLSAEDYYRIILTDEQDVDQALARLRKYFYKNLMDLEYDNTRTRTQSDIDAGEEALEKEPIEVLQELFLKQNGTAMNDFQTQTAARLIEEIWGADQ
ncbi:MAG: exonuclease SbcCD subunit D [Lachnospiraceae bacterium]|nr:exonuclease SbcCD subunit D [Lachnospiraceae bacterium]